MHGPAPENNTKVELQVWVTDQYDLLTGQLDEPRPQTSRTTNDVYAGVEKLKPIFSSLFNPKTPENILNTYMSNLSRVLKVNVTIAPAGNDTQVKRIR